MVEMNKDVWRSRDLPVLALIAARIDRGEPVGEPEISRTLGADPDVVAAAFRSLARSGLIEGPRLANGNIQFVMDVSARAYQLTGLHPNPDERVDKLLELLDDAIAKSADEHERTALQAVRANLGDVGKQTIAGILSALIAAYVGGIGG